MQSMTIAEYRKAAANFSSRYPEWVKAVRAAYIPFKASGYKNNYALVNVRESMRACGFCEAHIGHIFEHVLAEDGHYNPALHG